MDYNLVEFLRMQKNVSKEEVKQVLDMSTPGYNKMIKQKTMTVANLETLARYYKVSICTFFKNEPDLMAQSDESAFIIRSDYNYIHREAFLEAKNQWKEEREQLRSHIKFLQDLVNDKFTEKKGSANHKAG